MPLPLAKARRGSSPQPSPQPARSSCRSQLEQDVKRLRKALQDETALHAVLEGALGRAAVTLADMAYLPTNAQELLSTICILETAVTKLEEEMVSLHFQLTQERNERRLVEYRLKHLPPPPSACSCHSGKLGPDDPTGEKCSSQTEEVYPRAVLHEQAVKLQRQISVKSFVDPNQLSEDIVRCMRNIFISLSDSCRDSSRNSNMENQQSIPSPTGNYSISAFWTLSEPSSISSWVQSPQVDLNYNNNVLASETVFDPYKAREKLSWADIGSYGAAAEVSWMSVGKKQLEYAAESLRKFRLFIEQLAEINPIHLSDDARLAFWINLYNALMMHAYLAYGVPRSDMKLFSLMQKAAYTIGGHSFSAAFIEYVILKMKPPSHRPQMALLLALQKIKVPEEQKKFCIAAPEPLLTFALSCGMYSSPGVKIYTANNVREELQDAQRDFIRASVGVSRKGKLLAPKILHCFARGFVDDNSFPIWISHFLPQQQATFVDHCVSQRRQSLLGTRTFGVVPFDSRFRYLFLPDAGSLN
ncbi:hypothetical protein Zm00014a_031824 [Zea mays]|uniref:Ternary complex factor MIP1-like n=2 Tax=Zea mays TaxID=4577 RepID=A0A979HIZ5_MAIZE|nr:uncharacterized protein LOC100382664 [Zea mays]AQK66928.1 transcription factor [Zea mays]PWZ21104.1 hypothetical protein Zm00014a_031824 [Zea mays]PWZ21105.1 hypothetical protein Zm00014a_031824 [Zea mays]PWZ21106.1 hypothetical protein Zm00014a_031824 [Zea mays]